MRPEDILNLLRQRPFQPFRLHLTDGRVFDIRYPEINMVTRLSFLVGIPDPDAPDPRAKHAVELDWSNVDHVEPLPAVASAR
jgi:hypothetical protein